MMSIGDDQGDDAAARALTNLVLALFRTNNAALLWGDRMVAPFGLTSARWQVMGAIAYAEQAQTVAWLARDLGANRQNVQRIVNELAGEGLVAFSANPTHKRAHLVELTPAGASAYAAAVMAWNAAAARLARDLPERDLAAATRVMITLRDAFAVR